MYVQHTLTVAVRYEDRCRCRVFLLGPGAVRLVASRVSWAGEQILGGKAGEVKSAAGRQQAGAGSGFGASTASLVSGLTGARPGTRIRAHSGRGTVHMLSRTCSAEHAQPRRISTPPTVRLPRRSTRYLPCSRSSAPGTASWSVTFALLRYAPPSAIPRRAAALPAAPPPEPPS